MSRLDISPYLIHFTSDETLETAFKRLQKIISERKIIGTENRIRGGYKCICFSEAPIVSLTNGLVNPNYYSRYSPFGILFNKSWIFSKGGRPVIYQSDEEYDLLPESHKWRHVLYRPESVKPIDFTWEREWRIKCDLLEFDPNNAEIVVLNVDWALRLRAEHEIEQFYMIEQYNTFMSREIAQMYHEDFHWKIITLS